MTDGSPASGDGDVERQRHEFAMFYRDNVDAIRAYVSSLSPALDAEAVANEACARTYQQWALLTGSRRAWAFRVAHNLACDTYRTKPPIPMPTDELPDRPSTRFPGPELRYELLEVFEAINSLPKSLRYPMLLAAQGLEPREIAEVLDMKPRTVSKYLNRARVRLSQLGLADRPPPDVRPHEPPGAVRHQLSPGTDHTEHTGSHHA